MSGSSNDSTGPSTADTLAAVFAGASTAYLDSQNGQPITVTEPVPGTAYGLAGTTQQIPTAAASAPSWLWIGGLLLLGVLILRR